MSRFKGWEGVVFVFVNRLVIRNEVKLLFWTGSGPYPAQPYPGQSQYPVGGSNPPPAGYNPYPGYQQPGGTPGDDFYLFVLMY